LKVSEATVVVVFYPMERIGLSQVFILQWRLSQNFSFWGGKLCLPSFLGFRGKSGLPATFSMSLAQNRALLAHSQLVLGQAQ
jgi:hypothetical protein